MGQATKRGTKAQRCAMKGVTYIAPPFPIPPTMLRTANMRNPIPRSERVKREPTLTGMADWFRERMWKPKPSRSWSKREKAGAA